MPAPTFNTEILRLLHFLGETNSLTESAARLEVSVSKASRLLHEAREVFRDQLFIRSGTSLAPTSYFLSVRPEIEDVLESLGRLPQRRVFEPKRLDRVFRIACLDCVLDTLILPAMLRCGRDAPNLRFEVCPAGPKTLSDLSAGAVDFFAFGSTDVVLAQSFHSQTYLCAPFVLVLGKDHEVARAFAQGSLPDAETVLSTDFVGFGAPFSISYDESDTLDRLQAQSRLRLPYSASCIAAVLRTGGVAAVPKPYGEWLAERMPDLAVVPFGHLTAYRWEPTLFWNHRLDHDPAAQWFRGMLSVVASELIRAYALETDRPGTHAIASADELLKGLYRI